jgi:hypothetical protein
MGGTLYGGLRFDGVDERVLSTSCGATASRVMGRDGNGFDWSNPTGAVADGVAGFDVPS